MEALGKEKDDPVSDAAPFRIELNWGGHRRRVWAKRRRTGAAGGYFEPRDLLETLGS